MLRMGKTLAMELARFDGCNMCPFFRDASEAYDPVFDIA
jgi:hypothetical protein